MRQKNFKIRNLLLKYRKKTNFKSYESSYYGFFNFPNTFKKGMIPRIAIYETFQNLSKTRLIKLLQNLRDNFLLMVNKLAKYLLNIKN